MKKPYKEYTQKDFKLTKKSVGQFLANEISGRDLANIAYKQMQGMLCIETNIDEPHKVTKENMQGEIGWHLDSLSFTDYARDKESLEIVEEVWAFLQTAYYRYKFLCETE